jgi:DUF1680 family protein
LKTAEWAYGVSDRAVWVALYGGSALETDVPGAGRVHLEQKTDYPWAGDVRIDVQGAGSSEWTLMLRIPGWAAGASVKVNGAAWGGVVAPGAHAAIRRTWVAGDKVELALPMEARLMEANPYVEFTRNQAAVMRGPVVYCLESPDLPAGTRVDEVQLPRGIRLAPRPHPGLPGGIPALEGEAVRRAHANWDGALYRMLLPAAEERIPVRLIPYFAWANRGSSYMTVWMPLAD